MRQKLWLTCVAVLLLLPVALLPFQTDIQSYRSDAKTANLQTEPVQWLEQRLALRTAMITVRGWFLQCIGASGSDQVMQGEDGFLFYTESLSTDTDGFEQSIDQLCRLQQELNDRGRTLYVLIAPDKRSVYPQKLAYNCALLQDSTLPQIQDRLQQSGLDVIDAEGALENAKEDGQVYYSADTHWNARGSLAVYQEIITTCGLLDAPKFDTTAFETGTAGDLQVLCLPGISTMEPDATPVLERAYRTVKPIRTMNDMKIETKSSITEYSLLFIRDSFGAGLFPYFANSMGHLVLSRNYMGIAEQAASCDAEIVILEVVQRNFGNLTLY